jgi:hypothetical protein
MPDALNPLEPHDGIPHALAPLVESAEFDQLEADKKAVFLSVFASMLRPGFDRVDRYGIPHRGGFGVVERFVKAAGLALERQTSQEAFMSELYRAWVARNPKRGTAFLRAYLQLLWPGRWTLDQLHIGLGQDYPRAATVGAGTDRILTSRLLLTLELAGDETGDVLSKMTGSFKAVLPARLVLDTAVGQTYESTLRLANLMDETEIEEFEGTADNVGAPPPPPPPPAFSAPLTTDAADTSAPAATFTVFGDPTFGATGMVSLVDNGIGDYVNYPPTSGGANDKLSADQYTGEVRFSVEVQNLTTMPPPFNSSSSRIFTIYASGVAEIGFSVLQGNLIYYEYLAPTGYEGTISAMPATALLEIVYPAGSGVAQLYVNGVLAYTSVGTVRFNNGISVGVRSPASISSIAFKNLTMQAV